MSEEVKKVDLLIGQIRKALGKPATSWEEVRERVERMTREEVTNGHIDWAVAHLRKYHQAYGFNIYHIGRGRAAADGRHEGRIFLMACNASSISDEERLHALRGTLAISREALSKEENQAAMIELTVGVVKSPAAKAKLMQRFYALKAGAAQLGGVIEAVIPEIEELEEKLYA
jgi:hypothetical protein